MFSPILNKIVPHESRIYTFEKTNGHHAIDRKASGGLASTFSMYPRNNLSFFLYKFLEECKRQFIFRRHNLQIQDAIIQEILKLPDILSDGRDF